jgi:hypothetical protein
MFNWKSVNNTIYKTDIDTQVNVVIFIFSDAVFLPDPFKPPHKAI